jgi:hypothetical protein
LELEDKALVLSANSRARSDRARATIRDARIVGGTALGQDAIRRTVHGITELHHAADAKYF